MWFRPLRPLMTNPHCGCNTGHQLYWAGNRRKYAARVVQHISIWNIKDVPYLMHRNISIRKEERLYFKNCSRYPSSTTAAGCWQKCDPYSKCTVNLGYLEGNFTMTHVIVPTFSHCMNHNCKMISAQIHKSHLQAFIHLATLACTVTRQVMLAKWFLWSYITLTYTDMFHASACSCSSITLELRAISAYYLCPSLIQESYTPNFRSSLCQALHQNAFNRPRCWKASR